MEGGVATGLGGVLFMINLMVRLDLPACFEEQCGLASRAGAWGTLELLGRGLLRAHAADHADPLWPALALLAGRVPGSLAGAALRVSRDLHLPASWPVPGPGAPRRRGLTAGLGPGARRWLALVVPPLRDYLCRGLGLAPGGDLTVALLAQRGRLYVTNTHVDLVLGLDAIALPIRMSGLDRDPGWLPEFGRVILFHFE